MCPGKEELTIEKQEHAKEQARAQLDSILAMVKRVDHCRGCDGSDNCDLTDQDILEGIDLAYEEGDTANEEERQEYHDEEAAREAIQEDPLEVSVRSDWHQPGGDTELDEYRILLCTGGPAVQITGKLGKHGEPDDAKLQYQDWFTPWCNFPTTSEEDRELLDYARQFYFTM